MTDQRYSTQKLLESGQSQEKAANNNFCSLQEQLSKMMTASGKEDMLNNEMKKNKHIA